MAQGSIDLIRQWFNFDTEYKILPDMTPAVLAPDGNKLYIDPHAPLSELGYSISKILVRRKLKMLGFECESLNGATVEHETLSLLLPDQEFQPHSHKPLSDISLLFPFCTLEVLAKRILYFQKRILTIWNNYRMVLRTATKGLEYSKTPMPFETECMHYAYKVKNSMIRKHENRGIRCDTFFQSEEGKRIHRIIMLTQFLDTDL
jgi:hypothetical protein